MPCRPIDLFPLIAKSHGGAGMCAAGDDFSDSQKAELLNALNRILPILMKRLDAKETLARWDIPVQGGVFGLPGDCLDVRQAFLNGCALDLKDQWYEGRLGAQIQRTGLWCGSRDLIDMGDGYATPMPFPTHVQDYRYGLMAENNGDAGKTVQLRLRDRYGNVVDETVTLLPHQQVASTKASVTDVLFQHKGVTQGAIVGFVTHHSMRDERILRMPANVTTASYHRKKLPISFGCCEGCLTIIGKLRFTPLVSEFDPLPICDVAALSFGFQALFNLDSRDLAGYNDSLTLAVNELNRELSDVHPSGTVTQMNIQSPVRFHQRAWN
jgi:hypothetical protein